MQTIGDRIWTSDVWALCTETYQMHWPFSYIRHNIAVLAANQTTIEDLEVSLNIYLEYADPGAVFFDLADALVLA